MMSLNKEGVITCRRFGDITPIDCKCLRNSDCAKCIIFETLEDSQKEPIKEQLELPIDLAWDTCETSIDVQ